MCHLIVHSVPMRTLGCHQAGKTDSDILSTFSYTMLCAGVYIGDPKYSILVYSRLANSIGSAGCTAYKSPVSIAREPAWLEISY